jgi:hypothetical protein
MDSMVFHCLAELEKECAVVCEEGLANIEGGEGEEGDCQGSELVCVQERVTGAGGASARGEWEEEEGQAN